jgi:AcrR family transcriptional regulator
MRRRTSEADKDMTPQIETEPTPVPAPRTQRADARRNRAKVLAAARRQLADHGLETQIEQIAADAGVGVGTVYRHFPTKEALLEALADDKFEGLARAAREGLEIDDPWEGFVHLMTYAARSMSDDRGLSEAMDQRPEICGAAAVAAGLDELSAELVQRAQAAGELRSDLTPDDVPSLICGLGRAVRARPDGAPSMSWQRYLDIILAGLRA